MWYTDATRETSLCTNVMTLIILRFVVSNPHGYYWTIADITSHCDKEIVHQILHWVSIQYIPRNMHTVFALLCFVVVIHWLILSYPSGLLHWHCGNLTIAPVPAKQPWWIWINTSCEFIMNDCITTTKQSTTKPCAYFLGYTVGLHIRMRNYTASLAICVGNPYKESVVQRFDDFSVVSLNQLLKHYFELFGFWIKWGWSMCGLMGNCPDRKVHAAHMGPVGPRWAPCLPHEPCYQGPVTGLAIPMSESSGHWTLVVFFNVWFRIKCSYIGISIIPLNISLGKYHRTSIW